MPTFSTNIQFCNNGNTFVQRFGVLYTLKYAGLFQPNLGSNMDKTLD